MPTSWGLRDIANKHHLIHININPLKLLKAAAQDKEDGRANLSVNLYRPPENDIHAINSWEDTEETAP